MTEDELTASAATEAKAEDGGAPAPAEGERAPANDEAPRAETAPSANGGPKKSSVMRIASWVLLAVAIAAGVAVFVGRRQAPLPAYDVSWTGDRLQRGDDGLANAVITVNPLLQTVIVVRPTTPVKGPVEVRACVTRGGAAREWKPPIEISDDGAVRISGPSRSVFDVPPGMWTAVVAVGRPGDLPSDPNALARGPDDGAPWQAFTKPILVRPPR
jgi:hypothetical protein